MAHETRDFCGFHAPHPDNKATFEQALAHRRAYRCCGCAGSPTSADCGQWCAPAPAGRRLSMEWFGVAKLSGLNEAKHLLSQGSATHVVEQTFPLTFALTWAVFPLLQHCNGARRSGCALSCLWGGFLPPCCWFSSRRIHSAHILRWSASAKGPLLIRDRPISSRTFSLKISSLAFACTYFV